MQFLGDTGTHENFAGATFSTVAVHFGKLDLQLGDLHTIVFRHLGQRVDTIPLLLYRPHFLVSHDDRIHHRELLKSELILAQPAQTLIGRNGDITGGGYQAAIQNFHKGGLATAIGANQAITVAITEFDRDVFE